MLLSLIVLIGSAMVRVQTDTNACLHPVALPFVSGSHLPLFRCGKCSACLRHKGAQLAVRLFREMQSLSKVFFITFTYRNEDLPIQSFEYVVNRDTGSVDWSSSARIDHCSGKLFYKLCPGEYLPNKTGKRSKRCFPLDVVTKFDDVYEYHNVKYWTICAKDIQDAFKRFRHHLKFHFKYFLVPEYGGVTFRPHIHLCLVGCSRAAVDLLVKEWKYGRVDVREVSASAADRSKQLAKLSSYVSKYSCKGKFDCPYISEGYCLKPRRCSSCRFGFGSDSMYEDLKRWLLAEDVFGKYDYKNIDPSDEMVKILSSRRYICINEVPYPLPKLFVDEFFKVRSFVKRYYYVCENNQVKKVPYYVKSDKSTPLQSKVASFVLGRLVQDARRECFDLLQVSENLRSSGVEAFDIKEDYLKTRERTSDDSFRASLLNSLV